MILLDISGADATLRKQDTLTCGMVGAKVRFRFNEVWDGLTKTAVFRCGKVTKDSLLTGDTAVIPHEALTAPGLPLQIGVYGADEGGALVIPTVWAATCPVRPGADPSGDEGTDPTLPVWAEIRAKAETNGQNIENLTDRVDALRRQVADRIVPPPIVETAAGMTVSAPISAESPLQGLTLYGKTTQAGTPTPGNPVALESVGDSGEINVAVCGENNEPQTLLVSTPDGLPGIPVSSGGNYTDESGQQWLCDEIDFGRGVYVQRVHRFVCGEDMKVETVSVLGECCRIGWDLHGSSKAYAKAFSTHLTWKTDYSGDYPHFYCDTFAWIFLPTSCGTNANEVREWMVENQFTILYQQNTPTETALSPEELAAFAALRTNYPDTTVSNDAGAGMKLSYVADTKLYIDRQFAQLSGANA